MTLPRILSTVGRALAVLGVVMLLFVVFQLWGTGLQQAQAQSDLESDLAARFRQAAEAGQSALDPTGSPPGPDAGDAATRSTGALPAQPQPASGTTGAAAGPAAGPIPPAGPESPGDDAAVASPPDPEAPATGTESSTRTGTKSSTRTGTETGTAGAAGTLAAASPPASLPEYPGVPQVVSHVSEPAAARSVARLLDDEVEELLPLVYPTDGEAIARIMIPSIDVDEIVVAGVGVEDLRKGPGHYSTTPLPGQPGNAAIAGHRTTYGAPFGRLNELNAGDAIIVETLQGRFTYRVLPGQPGMAGHALGFRIVAPTALEVLDDVGDDRLTLTSCHPKYSSRKRIIVHAALVGDPVVRLPRPGEPIGAEFVQLAEPEEQSPGADTVGPPEVATPEGGDDGGDLPASGDDGGDPPASGSPGTAPEHAAEAAGPAEGDPTPAPEDSGAEQTGDDADTGDTAPRAQRAIPPSDAETLPSGEADRAAPSHEPVRETPQAAAPARETVPRAPATPVTEAGFGEGLSGDRDAILPAVLWGLAAAAVWALGWTFGRAGRRALRYSVAVVGFLVVLYVTFSYVDRALPAY